MSYYTPTKKNTTDDREDVLVREDHTTAPWSVYVDVSPRKYPDFDNLLGTHSGFVSDEYRVWEHLDDTLTLSRAIELLEVYSIDPEFAGQTIGVYSNNSGEFIQDHPVFSAYKELT